MKKKAQVSIKPRHPRESPERMIRRFLKKVKKERIVEEVRERRRYKKPSVKKKEKQERKELLDCLPMLNKESYIISDEMSFATKKRIKIKHQVRDNMMEKLKTFIERPNVIRRFDLTNDNMVKNLMNGVNAGITAMSSKQKDTSQTQDVTITHVDSSDSDDESEEEEEGEEEEKEAKKLQNLFDNGYDRIQYLENLRNQTGREVTILVHHDWELIYSGEDNKAEVTGLVPLEVLAHDPGLSVPVMFCVQICGADFPAYEHSQLSEVVEFKTTSDKLAAAERMIDLGPIDEVKSEGSSSPLGTPPPSQMFKKEKRGRAA